MALFAGRRLDVEVDGERYHRAWNGGHVRRYQIRTQCPVELEWDVVGFWVYQVRDDLDGRVQRISRWAEQKRR